MAKACQIQESMETPEGHEKEQDLRVCKEVLRTDLDWN